MKNVSSSITDRCGDISEWRSGKGRDLEEYTDSAHTVHTLCWIRPGPLSMRTRVLSLRCSLDRGNREAELRGRGREGYGAEWLQDPHMEGT